MFGQNLKRLREAQGLNQVQLAEKCGLTSQAVNQIEKGKRWPREETANALATALSCTLSELYGIPAASSTPVEPMAATAA